MSLNINFMCLTKNIFFNKVNQQAKQTGSGKFGPQSNKYWGKTATIQAKNFSLFKNNIFNMIAVITKLLTSCFHVECSDFEK